MNRSLATVFAVTFVTSACGVSELPGSDSVTVTQRSTAPRQYVGCYIDDEDRALGSALIEEGATVEACIEAARAAGYAYAGLQWYGQCFAGDTLGRAPADESDCSLPCSADPSEVCGGGWRNSIYSTGAMGPDPRPRGGDPVVSGYNYTGIRNDRPLPADFRPFLPESIWNRRLPETPQQVEARFTPMLDAFAANSETHFYTEAENGLGGFGGFPIYLASDSDPLVTVDCAVADLGYGCSPDSTSERVASIPGYFHIPADARPGCTDRDACGDMNLTVIQADGTMLDIYGCMPTRDWRDGDVVGGEVCSGWVSGVSVSNVATGYGYNSGSTEGGDAFAALLASYNEVVPEGAVIQHALEVRLPCSNGEVVYPGHGLYECAGGIPAGSLIHLTLSHAEIDELIAQGVYAPQLRPFLYAFHDYGAYFLDGGSGAGGGFQLSPRMESASPWLRNGGTNPWIPWFQAQGGYYGTSQAGVPMWAVDVNFYPPLVGHLEVLSPCYAEGTCVE